MLLVKIHRTNNSTKTVNFTLCKLIFFKLKQTAKVGKRLVKLLTKVGSISSIARSLLYIL